MRKDQFRLAQRAHKWIVSTYEFMAGLPCRLAASSILGSRIRKNSSFSAFSDLDECFQSTVVRLLSSGTLIRDEPSAQFRQ